MKSIGPLFVYIHPNHLNQETRKFEKDPRTAPVGVAVTAHHPFMGEVEIEVSVSRRFTGKVKPDGSKVNPDKWDRFAGRDQAVKNGPCVIAKVSEKDLPEGSTQTQYVKAGLSKLLAGGGSKNRAFNDAIQDTYNRMCGID